MKAAVIESFGRGVPVHIVDLPEPIPLDTQVQIAIKYAAVNPVDWKIHDGYLKTRLPHTFPIVLGWDAAGIVSKVGKNVRQFKIGDEVYAYCRKPMIQWGAYAEFVCVEASHVAHKPRNLSFAQSASIPLVGLTAWQSLFDQFALKKDKIILIHAGAGGVGGMAIQFAKNAGAYVITTASTKNHEYVKKLGADVSIDYAKENFVDRIRQQFPEGIDMVFDTVGGEECQKSFDVLKDQGRLVSICEPSLVPQRHIRCFYVFVEPNSAELKCIADLLEQKKVFPLEIEEMPLESVEKALEKSRIGHVRGKIVLSLSKI